MPSMTNYQIGDLRPALVILDTGDADVLLARVTTHSHGSPFDVPISAWKQAGLLAPSIVRLHKLATLAKSRVHKHLGSLEAVDRQAVAAVLQQIAAAW